MKGFKLICDNCGSDNTGIQSYDCDDCGSHTEIECWDCGQKDGVFSFTPGDPTKAKSK